MADVPLLKVAIAGTIAFIGCDIGQVTGVGLAAWTDGDVHLIFAAPNLDLGGQVCAQ